MDAGFAPTPQNAIGFFAGAIHRDMRLVGGRDILFGKLKVFIRDHLFDRPVDLDDLDVLRNLSEPEVSTTLTRVFKKAINVLTVVDRGATRVQDRIKMSRARPQVVSQQADMKPKKSIFNRVVGDSALELDFARFLDGRHDIVSFVKNTRETNFSVEYRTADGSIANYFPDFVVKRNASEIWIVETKGREDLNDPRKIDRVRMWCADASAAESVAYRAMYVLEEVWEKLTLKSFAEAVGVFAV